MTESVTTTPTRAPLSPIPLVIFSSRWLQLPLYLGLIVAQLVYVFLFLKELWHLIEHFTGFNEQEIMLVVLGRVDGFDQDHGAGESDECCVAFGGLFAT